MLYPVHVLAAAAAAAAAAVNTVVDAVEANTTDDVFHSLLNFSI